MKPDVRKLNKVGKITLTDQQVADLEELFNHEQAKFPPGWSESHPIHSLPLGQQDKAIRGALLTFLFEIWRDAGGKGYGARQTSKKDPVQGPFIRFVEEVFQQFEIKQRNGRVVSSRQLRRDLAEFRTELEPVGRKRRPAARKRGAAGPA